MCGQMQPNWQTFICNFIVTPAQVTSWKDDAELKQQYGCALAQSFKNPFEAACSIFDKETQKALFVSVNWINDPEVLKAKEEYNAVTTAPDILLDKVGLSRKLLAFADEKINFNGNSVFAAEAKDRLAALKLYAEIQQFIGKNEINNNNNFYQANNKMEIVFVEPDKKEEKIIEHKKIEVEDILENSPIKLKLVG